MHYLLYYLLFIPLGLFALYFVVMAVPTFFKNRNKIGEYAPQKRLALLIPARNEQQVVTNLVKSLHQQNYPKELYDIYVLPNNCTDQTAQVALDAGAKVMEITRKVKSKGEVLEFAFDKLMTEENHDAYIILDADNTAHPNFLQKMNDAICEGYEVAQGNRDSSNPETSWVSGSSSLYYWFLNVFMHRARMNIKKSAVLNGTGFMVQRSALERIGYHTVTLTEDIEFSLQCGMNGIRIGFVEDAIIYDEQPTDIRTSMKQRKRWSAGCYQLLSTYRKQLFSPKSFRRNAVARMDMIFVVTTPLIHLLYFVLSVLMILFKLTGNVVMPEYAAYSVFFTFYEVYSVFITYGIQVIIGMVTIGLYHKRLLPSLKAIFSFPLFLLTWLPLNIVCLFNNNIVWEPIRHTGGHAVRTRKRIPKPSFLE